MSMETKEFGFVFEIGVIAGTLTAIHHLTKENKMFSEQHTVYLEELETITLQRIQKYFRTTAKNNGIIDLEALNRLDKFSEYLIFLGVHKGYHFMEEYCQSMQSTIETFRNNPLLKNSEKTLKIKPKLLYYQCDLQQLFRADRLEKSEIVPRFQILLKQQLNLEKAIDYLHYNKKGEFLNADIIMLFQLYDRYRIVVIDVSSFLTKYAEHIPDMCHPKDIKNRLQATKNHLREKSAFEQLAIDTEGNRYERELGRFIRAFGRRDKPVLKVIQAGSYAYSFYNFLNNALPKFFNHNNLEINALGLTDRENDAIFISEMENISVLKTCQEIFVRSKETQEDVSKLIFRNFKRTFQKTEDNVVESDSTALNEFVNTLQTVPPEDKETRQAVFEEKLIDFTSTADSYPTEDKLSNIRDKHAQLVTQALDSDNELIFLTGHPGIGKTTAVVEYLLREEILAEGVIFFYISPRIQVNRDIIEKFKDAQQNKLRSDSLICIHTDSVLIKNNGGRPIVKYVCNERLSNELMMPTAVVGKNATNRLTLMIDEEEQVFHESSHNYLKSINDGRMAYQSKIPQGVLNTICSAVCTLRVRHQEDEKIPKNIVATLTMQSLKTSVNGRKTTEHIRKIFADAKKSSRDKTYSAEKLSEISRVNKHLIFMIDEVIGDQSGIQFIHDLVNIVKDKDLKLQKDFKLKIIASDASILGKDVIEQHLTDKEPSPGKILYRHVEQQGVNQPLFMQSDLIFERSRLFKQFKATIINANTFPARDLMLTYKVGVAMRQTESYQFDEGQQTLITQDVLTMLKDASLNGQIIVYIQDIQRLNKLIEEIKSQSHTLVNASFERFVDYLEIHSGIQDKDKVLKYKNGVKIIFMTASASRGITFPGVRHILLEIPRFQIEQNLMEVIQTVYRGRGGETEAHRALEKQTRYLTIYFHDVIYYSDENQRTTRYHTGIVGLLNMILLSRAALKTRIQGYGNIGRHQLRIIPVGEKHLSSTGNSLLTTVSKLLQIMNKEIRKSANSSDDYDSSLKKLRENVEEIFSHTRTVIASENFVNVRNYYAEFKKHIFHGLQGLVEQPFKQAYIDGDVLTVKIAATSEQIDISKCLLEKVDVERVVERMYGHAQEIRYPENLRTALRNVAGDIKEVLRAEKQTEQSQTIHSGNNSASQYFSMPLSVLFSIEQVMMYFQHPETFTREIEELEERTAFYDIIKSYLWSLYPLTDILPLSGHYAKYPFLLFRCDNLPYIRRQHFDRRYLFSSVNLNVLNLLLIQP